jgi:hypothetical protein
MQKPNKYRHKGNVLEVVLNLGKVALIDRSDYFLVQRYRWYAQRRTLSSGRVNWYVVANDYSSGRRSPKPVYMHQLVLSCEPPYEVDHGNGDGLDNRRANLQRVTHAQNTWNRRKTVVPVSSRFVGVYRVNQRWVARIMVHGKLIHLGYFATEIEAYRARLFAEKNRSFEHGNTKKTTRQGGRK